MRGFQIVSIQIDANVQDELRLKRTVHIVVAIELHAVSVGLREHEPRTDRLGQTELGPNRRARATDLVTNGVLTLRHAGGQKFLLYVIGLIEGKITDIHSASAIQAMMTKDAGDFLSEGFDIV